MIAPSLKTENGVSSCGGPAGQADHRALLRVFHQRPFAIVERQRHGIERERLDGTEPASPSAAIPARFIISRLSSMGFLRSFFVETGRHRTQMRRVSHRQNVSQFIFRSGLRMPQSKAGVSIGVQARHNLHAVDQRRQCLRIKDRADDHRLVASADRNFLLRQARRPRAPR